MTTQLAENNNSALWVPPATFNDRSDIISIRVNGPKVAECHMFGTDYQMFLYRFEADGFGVTGEEFRIDDTSAKRAAFDTAIELSRVSGELVQVTVFDSDGSVLWRVPELKPHKVRRTVRR